MPYADGGVVDDALRLANQGKYRLHQTIARHGYATDGAVTDLPSMAQSPEVVQENLQAPAEVEKENLREIAARPSPLKNLLDIGSTIGTYGVEKAREMPQKAYEDIKGAVAEPAKSAYHAAAQITGQEPYNRDEAIKHAMNIAGAMTLGSGAYEAPADALRSGLSSPLYHGSSITGLNKLIASERGPLGPGVYTSPAPNIAKRYAGESGHVYEVPHENLDIYRGEGHRSDDEYLGFEEDRQRLINAVPEEHREKIIPMIEKMWSSDGYPLYQRIKGELGSHEAAQDLFKKAGFHGISGQIDGPETLIFNDVKLPHKSHGGEINDALRLARNRHGYATDGEVKPEEPQVEAYGEVEFAPEYMPRPTEQIQQPNEASSQAFIHEGLKGSAPQYDPTVERGIGHGLTATAKWTPPGAVADAAGLLGGPSLYQNVKEGRYMPAALQVASVGLPAALAGRAAIAAGLGAGASKFTKLGKPDAYGMPGYIGYQTAEDWGPGVLGKETYEGAKKAGKAALEKGTNYIKSKFGYADGGEVEDALQLASGGGAWTRKEGQDPDGGLNSKGRASAKAEGHNLKPPAPHPKTEKDAGRRKSFCSRMSGMREKLTSAETKNDPDSRINKSLRAWNCSDGGAVEDAIRLASGGEVWEKPRPKSLGKPKHLSESQKASAKASAKAAGRPYPNAIDNINAAKRGK
jgi:hypothetical protein